MSATLDAPLDQDEIPLDVETGQGGPPVTFTLASEEPSKQGATASPGQGKDGVPKEPNPAGECRICLLSDDSHTFVKPCHCTGSLEYAHLKCLKSWVRERVDLHCEICKFKYNDALLVKLEPEILAGAAQRLQRRTSTVMVVPGQRIGVGGHSSVQQRNQRICGRQALIRALCVVLFVCALVGLLLFLGLNASDSPWAAILLRILAFGIPVLILIRGVVACMEIRRMTLANQRLISHGSAQVNA